MTERELIRSVMRSLEEDYGYPPDQISFEVGPADRGADLVVYSSNKKIEPLIVVEVKTRLLYPLNIGQIRSYLEDTRAKYGLLTDGIRKTCFMRLRPNLIVEVPDIPRRGEEIGPPVKTKLRPIENFDYKLWIIGDLMRKCGDLTPQEVAIELTKLVLCKIVDEQDPRPTASFWLDPNELQKSMEREYDEVLLRKIEALFRKVRITYPDMFPPGDKIKLRGEPLVRVISELQSYSFTRSRKEDVGRFYESLLRHYYLRSHGLFPSPRAAVRLGVGLLDPDERETLLDPACGSGEFLLESLFHVWRKIQRSFDSNSKIERAKAAYTKNRAIGIEVNIANAFFAQLSLALLGHTRAKVLVGDLLVKDVQEVKDVVSRHGGFDVIITRSPTGQVVTDPQILKEYEVAEGLKRQDSDVLFIEKCVKLLRPGGRMAILVLDRILFSATLQHTREYLLRNAVLQAVISLPPEVFAPYGLPVRTSIIVLEKGKATRSANYDVFMVVAGIAGHDEYGRPTLSDADEIVTRFRWFVEGKVDKALAGEKRIFAVEASRLLRARWDPGYYAERKRVERLRNRRKLGEVADLIPGVSVPSGQYLEKAAEGLVPYVRISDMVDGKTSSPRLRYVKRGGKPDRAALRQGDVLLSVRGTIGKVARVTEPFVGALPSSQLVMVKPREGTTTQDYLYYALSSQVVREQLSGMQRGVIIPFISIVDLRSIEIPVPSLEEQRELLEKIHGIEKEIVMTETRRASLSMEIGKVFEGEDVHE